MTADPHRPKNALGAETSPYLLQHADNPVAWYPWGETALNRARREDKPILLSIGYSACHWCHVMAHESFEDDATAALMNELFINIKVDREERPDLDKIYQTAQHLLTQHQGGWPLTMFLTPDDHIPFFGGTYFPREPRHGLPSFKEILQRVARAYRERREDIRAQNTQLVEGLTQLQALTTVASDEISSAPLYAAREYYGRAYDPYLGGFGRAPKFPHPSSVERLLRHYHMALASGKPDEEARQMALFSLERMAKGGIYDQLGGGFCRYSVDDQWMIPHFEKMLYDNGPLLALYSEAWQLTRDPLFARVARETAEWVLREMTSPAGPFYSSLDADSEGEEGKYYVWTRDEVQSLLGADYTLFAKRFGLEREPNFEGQWHLRICAEYYELANLFMAPPATLEARVDDARAKLFAHREQRIRPQRDDKILTSWNALMIKGLAIAGKTFDVPAYIAAAENALDFIHTQLWQHGRLLATYKDGKAHLNAYLDDYAFLLDAILSLLSARWRERDLEFAIDLAECLLEHFEDRAHGGFFFTSHDHEQLIQRTKSTTDDALPAGNGIAAVALSRLGHLLGEQRYIAASERTLRASWQLIEETPAAHNALLLALEEFAVRVEIIVIRGTEPELSVWAATCNHDYRPNALCIAIPNSATHLPGLLSTRTARPGTVAYICDGLACRAPLADLAAVKQQLKPFER